MSEIELGEIQTRFAELIWAHEPIGSGELVGLCEAAFGWKKPTTYTVLRKLCEKGLFQNRDGKVVSLISREDFYARKSRDFVDEAFSGSLPAFVAAFVSGKSLTVKEAEEIERLIADFRKEQ